MPGVPKIGSHTESRFQVKPEHTITLAGPSLPPVLATPWLIWFMEHAALDLLEPFLAPGEISVGTHIDIQHLAAALLEDEVTCTARLIHHEGDLYSFHIEARHDGEYLAKGIHKRRIVPVERLARRLQKNRP